MESSMGSVNMTMRANAIVFYLLAVALTGAGFVGPAKAGLITSAHRLDAATHHRAMSSLRQVLQREEIKDQLRRFGVSEQMLVERARHMTDEEVLMLAQNIETAVAGGDAVSLIGAVFIVLLVLELVGVTDVFKAL